MSITLDKVLYKRVKRRLPKDFIDKRCARCNYQVKIKLQYVLIDECEYIVTCDIVLCPYIGRGFIYSGKTAIERSGGHDVTCVSL